MKSQNRLEFQLENGFSDIRPFCVMERTSRWHEESSKRSLGACFSHFLTQGQLILFCEKKSFQILKVMTLWAWIGEQI